MADINTVSQEKKMIPPSDTTYGAKKHGILFFLCFLSCVYSARAEPNSIANRLDAEFRVHANGGDSTPILALMDENDIKVAKDEVLQVLVRYARPDQSARAQSTAILCLGRLASKVGSPDLTRSIIRVISPEVFSDKPRVASRARHTIAQFELDVFPEESRLLLRNGIKSLQYPQSQDLTLLGYIGDESDLYYLQQFVLDESEALDSNGRFTDENSWAARLALARLGSVPEQEACVRIIDRMDWSLQIKWYRHLAYTKSVPAAAYLAKKLDSDVSVELSDIDTQQQLAVTALKRMLPHLPVSEHSFHYSKDEIQAVRDYMTHYLKRHDSSAIDLR